MPARSPRWPSGTCRSRPPSTVSTSKCPGWGPRSYSVLATTSSTCSRVIVRGILRLRSSARPSRWSSRNLDRHLAAVAQVTARSAASLHQPARSAWHLAPSGGSLWQQMSPSEKIRVIYEGRNWRLRAVTQCQGDCHLLGASSITASWWRPRL